MCSCWAQVSASSETPGSADSKPRGAYVAVLLTIRHFYVGEVLFLVACVCFFCNHVCYFVSVFVNN